MFYLSNQYITELIQELIFGLILNFEQYAISFCWYLSYRNLNAYNIFILFFLGFFLFFYNCGDDRFHSFFYLFMLMLHIMWYWLIVAFWFIFRDLFGIHMRLILALI
jgi:hypothetical protein